MSVGAAGPRGELGDRVSFTCLSCLHFHVPCFHVVYVSVGGLQWVMRRAQKEAFEGGFFVRGAVLWVGVAV